MELKTKTKEDCICELSVNLKRTEHQPNARSATSRSILKEQTRNNSYY
jgi:hypothetical protein